MLKSINIVFAQNPGEKFTPIYEENEKLKTVSVNAGDTNLYVGGGGINRAFNLVLINSKQNTGTYLKLHTKAYNTFLDYKSNNRNDNTSNILNINLKDENKHYLKELYITKDDSMSQKDEQGIVCLDLFSRKYPLLNENNIGMVYIVGPRGCDYNSEEIFLKDVQITAYTIADMIYNYNLNNQDNKIEKLKMCLFSGLRYKYRNCSKKTVAKHIILGIAKHKNFIELDNFQICFAYDDDAFQKAYNKLNN